MTRAEHDLPPGVCEARLPCHRLADPRIERYATLLVGSCTRVEPGWQVLVWGMPAARPLVEEIMRQLGRRGAYPLLRLTFGGGLVYHREWLRTAPLELISEPAPLDMQVLNSCDALIAVSAPENTRDGSDIAAERTSAVSRAYRPALERVNASTFPWVMCWYPTPALAQEAGMTLGAFEEFLYGAVLLDWEAEHARLQRYADLFDAADEVRIVGEGTDLRLSLADRRMEVDAGMGNMPGGEFFGCPVETSAEGTIAFTEFPAVWSGREASGIRLRFSGGRVVDASADSEEDVPAPDARHGRWARAASASSGSAAILASLATWATSTSTRRSTGRFTLRSGSGSPTWAARTSRPSTGTSSRTCGRRPHRGRRPGRPAERPLGRLSR